MTSALAWGSGDYAGGAAARRDGRLRVLALSAASGMVALFVLANVFGEAAPSGRNLAWAAAAGIVNSIGLAALYQGLAIGRAATVAPVAAVLTAAVPAVYSSVANGLPGGTELAGFALAGVGIWLVSRTPAAASGAAQSGLALAVIAGLALGAFLTMIARVDPHLVFGPLGVARAVMLSVSCLLIALHRDRLSSPLAANPVALLAGLLDAAGNVLYLLARQQVRLDIAAVLSSLYPVATVALARAIGREPVTRIQWIGGGLCLAAVGLVTL